MKRRPEMIGARPNVAGGMARKKMVRPPSVEAANRAATEFLKNRAVTEFMAKPENGWTRNRWFGGEKPWFGGEKS